MWWKSIIWSSEITDSFPYYWTGWGWDLTWNKTCRAQFRFVKLNGTVGTWYKDSDSSKFFSNLGFSRGKKKGGGCKQAGMKNLTIFKLIRTYRIQMYYHIIQTLLMFPCTSVLIWLNMFRNVDCLVGMLLICSTQAIIYTVYLLYINSFNFLNAEA